MKLIDRPQYLNKLIGVRNTPDIKVITGVRRAGKSKLLEAYARYLKEVDRSANIVYIDLTKIRFEALKEYHALNDYIEAKYVEGSNNYMMIDEVQLCENFELTINSLHYIYEGPRTGKRGRPRILDGQIDFRNPDRTRMNRLDIDPAEGEAYGLVAWSRSLKRKVRLVLHYLPGGAHRLYFCTDITVCGMDVYDIYRTRFQIEFCFRDGHQFTGQLDCQARGEKALDFAYNASLAAVNVTKVLRKQTGTPFSIGQIKSLMVNAHFIRRFFELTGIDPHKTLNAKLVKELFGIATDAA